MFSHIQGHWTSELVALVLRTCFCSVHTRVCFTLYSLLPSLLDWRACVQVFVYLSFITDVSVAVVSVVFFYFIKSCTMCLRVVCFAAWCSTLQGRMLLVCLWLCLEFMHRKYFASACVSVFMPLARPIQCLSKASRISPWERELVFCLKVCIRSMQEPADTALHTFTHAVELVAAALHTLTTCIHTHTSVFDVMVIMGQPYPSDYESYCLVHCQLCLLVCAGPSA